MTARLRDLRQWVDWDWEQRDGKATKVPISPHEPRRAKSDDPTTWGTLTQARQSARERGYDGVGFVFTAEAAATDRATWRKLKTRDARARAWAYIFDCWHTKEGEQHVVTAGDPLNTGNKSTDNETGENIT